MDLKFNRFSKQNKKEVKNLKLEIIAYDKNDKNLIEIWEKETKEDIELELYNFDMIEVDFKSKCVHFTDLRYRTDEKFKNKHILAPIMVKFKDLDILIIKAENKV